MDPRIWSLAAVRSEKGAERVAALLPGGALVEIDVLPADVAPIDVLRQWGRLATVLQAWSPLGAREIKGAVLGAPLRNPGKVLCVGANYTDHRTEMATGDKEGRGGEPFFLLKPSATVIGPGEDILIRGDSDRVDWEAEVAVVIGKAGRFIEDDQALDHVAGYMLANDVSARAAHQRHNPIHPAFAFDWLASKGQDTFCPIGPAMLPAWFVDNPNDIPFSLTVNGAVEQSGSTAGLIVGIRDLIVAVSQLMTLDPGDIIATGTPGGVGAAKGRFLVDGDIVALSSPLLGGFSNPVRLLHDGAKAPVAKPTAVGS